MQVYVVKIDQYHEPEYYGFTSRKGADLFIEQHILERVINDPSANRACLDALKKKDYYQALEMWAESEGEYLSVIELSVDSELSVSDLKDLRTKLYTKTVH